MATDKIVEEEEEESGCKSQAFRKFALCDVTTDKPRDIYAYAQSSSCVSFSENLVLRANALTR